MNSTKDRMPDGRMVKLGHGDSMHVAKINPDSLITLTDCLVEPVIAGSSVGDRFQFLRQGYFCKDPDSTAEKPVFNRIVPLKDSWAKQKQ